MVQRLRQEDGVGRAAERLVVVDEVQVGARVQQHVLRVAVRLREAGTVAAASAPRLVVAAAVVWLREGALLSCRP